VRTAEYESIAEVYPRAYPPQVRGHFAVHRCRAVEAVSGHGSARCELEVKRVMVMLYELVGSRTRSEPPRLLGCHDTRRAALLARDRDILTQLEAAGGRRIELTHLLVTRGEMGPGTSPALACSVGQPIGWPVNVSAGACQRLCVSA
jgi:hypothetical protein